MRYWDFFPSDDADWGQVPVLGFANVVASAVEGISEVERFYGYFPPAALSGCLGFDANPDERSGSPDRRVQSDSAFALKIPPHLKRKTGPRG